MADIEFEIAQLKRERNAVILAHWYQDSEIQEVADFLGDSLALAQRAARTQADVIVLAGVRFMAETAKILNPERTVLLPDMEASCSLADGCPAGPFRAWRARHPDHVAITYINCTAEVKALSDIICTSSNAERIIRSIPEDQPILFAPDRNLGRYVIQKTRRDMLLWPGTCIVHETFSQRKIIGLKVRYPEALLIAHPECEEPVLRLADYISSTTGLIQFVQQSPARTFIVATEAGVLRPMRAACPEKTFIPAPPENGCGCNECPHMKRNTLEKVLQCLRDLRPEIRLDEDLRRRALKPLGRMLELSTQPTAGSIPS
jgi:quinolinate synthase